MARRECQSCDPHATLRKTRDGQLPESVVALFDLDWQERLVCEGHGRAAQVAGVRKITSAASLSFSSVLSSMIADSYLG